MKSSPARCMRIVLASGLGWCVFSTALAGTEVSNEGMFKYFVVKGQKIQAGLSPQQLVKVLGRPAKIKKNDAECGSVLDDSDKIYVYASAVFEASQKEAVLDTLSLTDVENELVIADQHINGKTAEKVFKQHFKNNLILDDDGSAFFSYQEASVREAGLLFEFKNGLVYRVTNWTGC